MLVGGAAGATVRIGGHFALAALATTVPAFAAAAAASPFAAALVSAVALGFLAGGVTKVAVTAVSGHEKDAPHRWRNAFLTGAAYGAVGGVVGLGIMDSFMKAESVVEGLLHSDFFSPHSHVHLHIRRPFSGHAVPPWPSQPQLARAGSLPPVPQPEVHFTKPEIQTLRMKVVPFVPPEVHAPLPSLPLSELQHLHPEAMPPVSPVPQAVPPPVPSLRGLISTDEMKMLPKSLQRLALSDTPRNIIHFCKEASYILMNGRHHDRAGETAGARLLSYGLKVAGRAGVFSHTVEQLHADEAYVKAWGLGTHKNIPDALDQAKLARHAVHNYGGRLLKAYGKLAHG